MNRGNISIPTGVLEVKGAFQTNERNHCMTEQENILRNAMADHGGAVYRLALCRLQNIADAEDVYQDVFLRLLEQETADWDSEHTKAWLLRATVNRCADLHRFRLRWPVLSLEEVPELARPVDDGAAELWDAVARLPEKLRTVVHLRPEREQEKICYSEGLTVLPSLTYSFGLTACAADTGEVIAPNANGGPAFTVGQGMADPTEGDFTGCLFQVTGDNIKTVSLSIGRGGLYRYAMHTDMTDEEIAAAHKAMAEGLLATAAISREDGLGWYMPEMTAVGDSFTEDYDTEINYGFWVPPAEMMTDPEMDLRQEAWANIDVFDGARLTVTVTFADSSEQSKTYRLSAGRLKIVYEEDGTINVLPTLAGDGELCVYGVYAASEEDSRWFRWPVQDSRTVSLSNPYGTVSGKTHNGIDIPAERGSVILAADGTVTETGFDTEKGNYLVLDHRDGLTTLYAHCRDVEAKEGDAVKAGEMIAAVGATGMATGSHLHFEVRQGGEAQDPVAYFDSNLRETLKAE